MMMGRTGDCLGIHRVSWHGSRLSVDGRELFCHFSAADVESVRIALNQAGSLRGQVWAGTVHDVRGLSEELLAWADVFVSRKFEQSVILDQVLSIEDARAQFLATRGVQTVRTYFSADRRRMICLYHAPDADSVRLAPHDAGVAVEYVWEFRQFWP